MRTARTRFDHVARSGVLQEPKLRRQAGIILEPLANDPGTDTVVDEHRHQQKPEVFLERRLLQGGPRCQQKKWNSGQNETDFLARERPNLEEVKKKNCPR